MEDKKYVNITKVYTKRGDKGETDLLGGSSARKDSLKVESYGCVDEASSFIGVARYYCKNKLIKERLKGIQNKLLVLGGFLASDAKGKEIMKDQIKEDDIKLLEEYIDEYNKKLPPLTHFILPGEDEVAAHFHVARTVVRRAERRIVSLTSQEPDLNPLIQKYVNRLSDLMFVLARYSEEVENKKWKSSNLNI
ncbi:cob(I)yrinic acid a,c-diamide adenosyltransferase [Fusobacterium canifelinum]|uniref:Corrinoid adenosyltransferase n=1 Tax=Fusobacterium canifelinum TaxID=285729 RepID=A0A7T9LGJ3_9FUSO|nr:cob(I)yrinic acid a,c-diamide adenosyltransferase [Fusobacterium canifelinum]QQB74983.1 cob(I)yrinic acid a,c-diamide adenosyltransferase [Fusobacterium canifelinum]QQS88505.1 cob(I)yrinic acid a,c-diamide adenosyltransferase [Fusobacterium canifelinum]